MKILHWQLQFQQIALKTQETKNEEDTGEIISAQLTKFTLEYHQSICKYTRKIVEIGPIILEEQNTKNTIAGH